MAVLESNAFKKELKEKSNAFKKELKERWLFKTLEKIEKISEAEEAGYFLTELLKILPDDLNLVNKMVALRIFIPNKPHIVNVRDAHYSRCGLSFDLDSWVDVMKPYLENEMDIKVDDNKAFKYNTKFDKFHDNIPVGALYMRVDITKALQNYLIEKKCLVVKWKEIPEALERLGYDWNRATDFITTIGMLRRYMDTFYPDIFINWCPHTVELVPCECRKFPVLDFDQQIFVSLLTMFNIRLSETEGKLGKLL